MGVRLNAETSAARLVGRLSRAVGRGGGTTLPGKLLWKVDPGALDALAAKLPAGVAVVSATNGKTTTSAMLARILGSRYRLAWNNSGANLASGVASTLLSATDADLGLLEVDEFALPEVMRRVRPRVVSLGNLFRDQLDRYGELEHIAERWRAAVAALPPTSTLVVNADDPLVAELADGRARRAALRRRRSAARPARAAARGRLEVLRPLRRPLRLRGRLRRPPRRLSLPGLRPRAARARRRGAVDRPAGARRVGLRPRHAGRHGAGAAAAARPLQRLQRPRRRRRPRSRSTRRSTRSRAGLGTFTAAFGRFERIEAGDRQILMLLIKNPAGANEAIRTLEEGGVPETLVIALNDRIADGRDVSWIWDVDFEPLLERAERIVGERRARGRARAAIHLRGLPAGAARGDPRPPRGTRSRARARPGGRRARRAPDLHRDARAARRSPSPAASCARTGRRRREDRGRPPLSGLPQHLRRPRQHRRARPARRAARALARGDGVEPGDALEPWAYDLVYVGGGQDREQALIAPDLAARGDDLRRAVETGTAVLAVCGGYQLLGRGYRGRDGSWMPGAGVLPARDASRASGG